MRILVVNWRDIENPWAGGAEVNIHEQAKRWVALGHSVTMLCGRFPRERPCDPETEIDGVRIIRRGGRFSVYFRAAWHYLRHLRGKYDVVVDIANGIPFFTPLYCRLPKVVLFHHVHHGQWKVELPTPLSMIGWFLEGWVVPRVYGQTKVLAVSQSTKRDLEALGFDGERIEVVYNGLSHDAYHAGETKPEAQRLIHLGRMMRYKRLDILLRLVAELRGEFPGLTLDLVGGGEAAAELEAQAGEMQIDDVVRFHGYVSQETKIDLLRRAYLLVVPSIKEGWGLTVLEANACGVPAVAFDVPGLNESIRHGETGLLASSYEELRDHVRSLLLDESKRHELAQGAVRWCRRFDWDTTARESLAVVASVCPEPQVADVPVTAPH